jgi:hypothetical protein
MTSCFAHTSFNASFLLLALSTLSACSDPGEEPDNTRLVYEQRIPYQEAPTAPGAILDTGEGVMATLGRALVYFPKSGGPMIPVAATMSGSGGDVYTAGFHPALAMDDTYVYYATQESGRYGYKTPYGERDNETGSPPNRTGGCFACARSRRSPPKR